MNSKTLIVFGVGAIAVYVLYRNWQSKNAKKSTANASAPIVALETQPVNLVMDTAANNSADLMANASGFPANVRQAFDTRMGGETVKTFDVSDTLNV